MEAGAAFWYTEENDDELRLGKLTAVNFQTRSPNQSTKNFANYGNVTLENTSN
jgi:hypothetical protein